MTRLLAALALAAGTLLAGQPADCMLGCPAMQCFGPCGGEDCLCLRRTISEPGWCTSAQQAPALLERGWTVLE